MAEHTLSESSTAHFEIIAALLKTYGELDDDELSAEVTKALVPYPNIDTDAEQRARVSDWASRVEERKNERATYSGALGDLAWNIQGRPPKTVLRAAGSVARWIVNHASEFVVLVAILVGASLRFSYSQYYAPFGLEPEDVGFGTGSILIHSLPGTFCLMAAAALVCTVLSLPMLAFWQANIERILGHAGPQDPEQKYLFIFIVGLDCCCAVALIYAHYKRTSSSLAGASSSIEVPFTSLHYESALLSHEWIFYWPAVIIFFSCAAAWFAKRVARVQTKAWAVFHSDSIATWFVVNVPIVLVVLLASLPLLADDRSKLTQRGEATRPLDLWALPLFGFKAEPVVVRMPAGSAFPGCVLLLGISDGQYILYRAKKTETIRMPASSVTIYSSHSKNCNA